MSPPDETELSGPGPQSPSSYDILIVSDLHLRGGYDNPTQGLYHFDEEFADFLRYYRLHRQSDRPWQLIIAGDFVEFLYLTDLPTDVAPLLRNVTFSASERRYGANSEAPKARWKLDTILRSSHPQLLMALARFIADGNQVVLLRGNHDAEMFWPEVQAHMRRLIAEHHPEDVSYLSMKQLVEQRVLFPEWFWYVPGSLYVEHGCQYDPFCSFEYFLQPVVPEHPGQIEMAISELAIRYFTNQMKLLNGMAAENIKSVSEYIGWVVSANLRILPRVFRLYFGMVSNVMSKSGLKNRAAERAVGEVHAKRVAEVDRRYGLAPGTAADVDAMHQRPVMRNRISTARFLALDLWAFAGLLVATTLVILLWFPARVGLLSVVGAIALAGLLLYVGALRFRRVTEAGRLRETAQELAGRFAVPYVVLGHSHAAGTWNMKGEAKYVNVGTWVPFGEDAYFVYFSLTGDGPRREGQLWRWNKRLGEPQRFAA